MTSGNMFIWTKAGSFLHKMMEQKFYLKNFFIKVTETKILPISLLP